MENIETLKQLKSNKKLEPYINYIRFPCLKNIEPNTRIDFDFPVTALVGQNGTNKSSILRAIYGCPKDYSLGSFWFSTSLDKIEEGNGRPRFIYGYFQPEASRNVEIIKQRIKYIDRKTKKENPDYWEPGRPIQADGMKKMPPYSEVKSGREKTRWKLIEKNVVFLDFRSEVSAFDKYFYHGSLRKTLTRSTKQDFIRQKSKLVKKAADLNLQSKKMYKNNDEKINYNECLSENEIKYVSDILGREYKEIRVISHSFFDSDGETAIIKTNDKEYSEAFAGSGEFAVIKLVHKIYTAKLASLIILDEPEVSLHPGAQLRLLSFLFDQVKKSKHQIIMGTHSPYLIEGLPKEAVKSLVLDKSNNSVSITNETNPASAFFHLEVDDYHKTIIYVEDRLAKEIVDRCLAIISEAAYKTVKVKFMPGGAESLIKQFYIPSALSNEDHKNFCLDGDKFNKSVPDVDLNKCDFKELEELFYSVFDFKPNYHVDGSKGKGSEKQKRGMLISSLEYSRSNLIYIPDKTPEEYIWTRMGGERNKIKNDFLHVENYKDKFSKACKKSLGKKDFEIVSADEIFEFQKQCLGSVSDESHSELINILKPKFG